jgi:hypothetical protein
MEKEAQREVLLAEMSVAQLAVMLEVRLVEP